MENYLGLGDLCGYIYFKFNSNSVSYVCALCEQKIFNTAYSIQIHFSEEHFNKSVESEKIEAFENENEFKYFLEENDSENLSKNQNCEHSLKPEHHFNTNLPLISSTKITEVSEKIESNIELLKEIKNESNCNKSAEKVSTSDEFIDNKEPQSLVTEFKGNASNFFPFGDELDEENLICKYCHKKFTYKKKLIKHIDQHLNFKYTCDICGEHFINSDDKKFHRKKHENKKCEICEKIFGTSKILEKHMELHFPLKCNYCEKYFKRKYYKRIHEMTHTGEKPFKCERCPIAFTLKKNLTTHFIRKHTEDKNHECSFCGDKFKLKESLKDHINRIHLKEKCFQCEHCGKKFSKSAEMKYHILREHGNYEDRPHKCPYCDMRYVQIKRLKEHIIKHTGERPYKCDICMRSFGRSNTLREHKKLHFNKKTHSCVICKKTFNQSAGLANHMKQHELCSETELQLFHFN